MRNERYRGFDIWGHAIAQEGGGDGPVQFSASGSVTREGDLVAASEGLDIGADEDAAQELGLAWARAWVDGHVSSAPEPGPQNGLH